MSNQQQQKKPQIAAPLSSQPPTVTAQQMPPPDDTAGDINKALGRVTVSYGAYEESFELSGKSVAYARQNLSTLFNIPSEAQALVNGQTVQNEQETLLQANTVLEFVKAAGQKG